METNNKVYVTNATVEDAMLILNEVTMEQRYVLNVALSFDRTNVGDNLRATMYGATWNKDIRFIEEDAEALIGGLDNYLCDLGSILGSIEDGEVDEPTIAKEQILKLKEVAQALFNTVEQWSMDMANGKI